jgi:glutamine phosphoribosylpyrophosphate amidotransferase
MNEKMNKEKALLVLKYIFTADIDGSWDDGDIHLLRLKILHALSPEDKVIEDLLKHLEEKSENYANSSNYAEDVFKDEGILEANFYAEEIKRKYGEDFFKEVKKLAGFWWW